ncbi:MAG: type II toxin-antitoxin system VapC family toxin [Deltaproteobacteria bacterium]|jgi:PIN domain nuclease of toxin-antitoxin system
MILLDTHVWWWAISEPEKLSSVAVETINKSPSDQRFIAAISLWEFAMMVKKKRIILNMSPKDWFTHAIDNVGTKVIPLSGEIALESCNLSGNFHKDPADRIIVATARIHNVLLVTKDQKILDYPDVISCW